MKSLQRFPGLQAKILATVDASLDEYRKKSREFVTHLVKMEGSLVIPQLFKVAEEQFGMDKQNMGTDAEYGKVNLRFSVQFLRFRIHASLVCTGRCSVKPDHNSPTCRCLREPGHTCWLYGRLS